MALTRARVVAGDTRLGDEIAATIAAVLTRRRDNGEARAEDVREMRALIAREKGDHDPWDLKLVSGGLIDIEFVAQFLMLADASERPDTARRLDPRDARRGGGSGRARARRRRGADRRPSALHRRDPGDARRRRRAVRSGDARRAASSVASPPRRRCPISNPCKARSAKRAKPSGAPTRACSAAVPAEPARQSGAVVGVACGQRRRASATFAPMKRNAPT